MKERTITIRLTAPRLARLTEAGRMLAGMDAVRERNVPRLTHVEPWSPERVLVRFLDVEDGVAEWAGQHDPRPRGVQRRLEREWEREERPPRPARSQEPNALERIQGALQRTHEVLQQVRAEIQA